MAVPCLLSDEEFKQDSDSRIGAEDIEDYYFASRDALNANNNLLSYLSSSGGTAGGALSVGRVVLVTSNRKQYQCVRAPSIIVRAPVASTTKNDPSDTTIICMVLLPEGYTTSEDDAKNLKLGDLDYVGRSNDRNFVIREIKLSEIFVVSSTKTKIDGKTFFRDEVKKASPLTSMSNPFASAKTMKSRQDDDFFGGMVARGKNAPSQPKTTAVSQEAQLVDEAMAHLVRAESEEKKTGVDLLDLRDCAKNMHQGSSEVEFRQAVDQMEHRVVTVRSYQCHSHPNLEKHYTTVDRKETLRVRVMTLRHLLSNESLQLFPDFLQRKVSIILREYTILISNILTSFICQPPLGSSNGARLHRRE